MRLGASSCDEHPQTDSVGLQEATNPSGKEEDKHKDGNEDDHLYHLNLHPRLSAWRPANPYFDQSA